MEDNSIFFQCRVLDNEDPLMLGRIRGVRLIDNLDDILKSITDPPWNPEKDPWTARDPLIFNSLLPYFLYQVPKVDELVQVVYVNKDFRYQNQYYVQNTFATPTASKFQYYQGANKFTGTGMQIANPKPLKNQDGTYTDRAIHEGVFPEPGDNALLGRGSADLIIKEDDLILRAGKFKGISLQPNVIPVNNPQRSFLQLSRFQSVKQNLPPAVYVELQENIVLTKYLVEWTITNPENTQDKFTGAVYLYQLKPDPSVNSKNITVNSVINENLKKLVATEGFSMLSRIDTIKFINDFIKSCNSTDRSVRGTVLFQSNDASTKFPIYYRPSPSMYSKMFQSTPRIPTNNQNYYSIGDKFCIASTCNIDIRVIEKSTGKIIAAASNNGPESELEQIYQSVINDITVKLLELEIQGVVLPKITQLDGSVILPPTETSSSESSIVSKNIKEVYNGVKLLPGDRGGYGLIYAKNKVGIPRVSKRVTVPQTRYSNISNTVAAMGGDKVYFLSHNSQIPGKGKINFDNSLYGINVEQFADIESKTSSSVRGEELLELLNLIVRFLVTHTHAYPGLPPVPVTQDGTTTAKVLEELQNAVNKILNSNIRIN